MPNVDRVTKVYTVQIANIIRTNFFFFFLKRAVNTPRKKRAVEESRKAFFRNEGILSSSVQAQFGDQLVKSAMQESFRKCLSLAEKNCIEDDHLSLCSVCMDRKADTYLIHGVTAHKCVCAVCAMTIALQRTSKPAECPICREAISLIVESAPMTLDCICGQESCARHLVVAQINDGVTHNKPDEMRSSCECHTCTLETKVERCSMVYSLYT